MCFTDGVEITIVVKGKVNCILVQALRLCTDRTAHRGCRGIALLFLDHGTKRGWVVSVTPRPLCTPGKDPIPILHEPGWAWLTVDCYLRIIVTTEGLNWKIKLWDMVYKKKIWTRKNCARISHQRKWLKIKSGKKGTFLWNCLK